MVEGECGYTGVALLNLAAAALVVEVVEVVFGIGMVELSLPVLMERNGLTRTGRLK